MGWAPPRKASPCRAARDRKDKLPELEQFGPLNFKKLSSSNDRALYGKPVRRGAGSWLVAPLFRFESAQRLKCATPRVASLLCFELARQLKCAATAVATLNYFALSLLNNLSELRPAAARFLADGSAAGGLLASCTQHPRQGGGLRRQVPGNVGQKHTKHGVK